MSKFFADYPWLAWIAIVVAIRFGISAIGPQFGSRQDTLSEILLHKALAGEDPQVKKLALDSLYLAARNIASAREYILENLSRRQARGKLPAYGQQLLARLQHDPQLVIAAAIAGMAPLKLRDLRALTVKISIALAGGLWLLLPAILGFFFGQRGLRQIYGNYSVVKIIAVNLLLATTASVVMYRFPDYLWLLQLVASGSALLACTLLVKNRGLSVFLGITAVNANRLLLLLLIVLTALFFPYWPTTTAAAIPESQLGKAIQQLAAEKPANATILLRRLLQNSDHLSPAVATSAIAALGKVGDQDSLTTLAVLVQRRDPQLQKAALTAMHKILTRRPRPEGS